MGRMWRNVCRDRTPHDGRDCRPCTAKVQVRPVAEPLGLFDAPAARAARDEGMKRGARKMDPMFERAAKKALMRVALRERRFIVDAVWQEMGVEEPEDGRIMGTIIRQAVKAGIIRQTADFLPSARRTAHGNPRRVWESLRYRDQAA